MGTSKKVVDKNDKITYIKHRKAGGEVLLSKFKESNFLSFDDEQVDLPLNTMKSLNPPNHTL